MNHSQRQVFQSRLWLKLAGALIVQGEEDSSVSFHGCVKMSSFHFLPLLELSSPPPKLPSAVFSSFVLLQRVTRTGPTYGDFHMGNTGHGGVTWP